MLRGGASPLGYQWSLLVANEGEDETVMEGGRKRGRKGKKKWSKTLVLWKNCERSDWKTINLAIILNWKFCKNLDPNLKTISFRVSFWNSQKLKALSEILPLKILCLLRKSMTSDNSQQYYSILRITRKLKVVKIEGTTMNVQKWLSNNLSLNQEELENECLAVT